MSGTESPDSAAFDVEAERVECTLKTTTSTSEIVSTFLIHSDMVELKTGLWGLTKLKRSCHSSEVLHFSDRKNEKPQKVVIFPAFTICKACGKWKQNY